MRSFSGGSNDRLRVKPGENAVVDFARGVRRSGFLLVAANLVPLFRFPEKSACRWFNPAPGHHLPNVRSGHMVYTLFRTSRVPATNN